ncbi:MAG: 3-hydroxybutyryl-CoA dehydrogenase [Dehalococcoidia bacterium]|nr:3-hydroxybutyryl-CoA dehydrogenase [Dehalococcoidia bacterium]
MDSLNISKVGVAGCGLMGSGIVEVTAAAGYDVVVLEAGPDLLEKGKKMVEGSLAMAVRRGKLSEEDRQAFAGRIKYTLQMEDFSDCGLVIEAVTENMDMKKQIFAGLDKVCREDAILATNTSCLSVIDIASATGRMDKVLGLHFFNPVPAMKLLEIVKTIATGDGTVETARAFGQIIGKTVVMAPDIPGFIVNRLLMPFFLEAIRLVESGQASREDIDRAVMLGLNHPMGPLKLADFVGLDTACFISEAMYREMSDARFAPPVLLKKMVTARRYGRKTGKGFYDYS